MSNIFKEVAKRNDSTTESNINYLIKEISDELVKVNHNNRQKRIDTLKLVDDFEPDSRYYELVLNPGVLKSAINKLVQLDNLDKKSLTFEYQNQNDMLKIHSSTKNTMLSLTDTKALTVKSTPITVIR